MPDASPQICEGLGALGLEAALKVVVDVNGRIIVVCYPACRCAIYWTDPRAIERVHIPRTTVHTPAAVQQLYFQSEPSRTPTLRVEVYSLF